MPIATKENSGWRVQYFYYNSIDISLHRSVKINYKIQRTSFYHKTLAPLLINLQHAALSTDYRFSKLYIRAVRTRLFHLLRNIFPPYNQLHERSHEGNSCLPVKAKTVTCKKVELSRHPFSFHSEKEDKAKIPKHLPKILEQATKQSQCWNRPFGHHLCF